MKRWLCYLAAVFAVAALNKNASAGHEIGDLQPVQTVALSIENGMVVLRTDTNNWGAGWSVAEAVADMEGSAPGKIFLETADYLLVTPECMDMVYAMANHLRPSCALCLVRGRPELEGVAEYLRHHEPRVTMLQYRAGGCQLQTLITKEGRMELVS